MDDADFPPFEPGTVWLVGAGPGAAGLISMLGYYALGQADVIVYDALVGKELLKFANPNAQCIYAGKRGGKPSPKQKDISISLIDWAKEGKKVLRLKGGDPFVFGRGGEESETLAKAGVKFRIVPGITSGIGGLAYAGIPVTHRDINQAVIFLTGHDETGEVPHAVDWQSIATAAPVIVMFMAVKHLSSISEKLIAAGRKPEDALAILSNTTLPEQSVAITTLGEAGAFVEREDVPTPAIVVIGQVVNYREILNWYTPSENRIG
ncbi:uroporphyrinogen-III C-methyltransferase [Maritalea porphyrae]|uniref:uroporphyrinogen-III C-methyltransferase n=1 Tax=Maritalea porphyrae TaxID=880732 RepID=UPI0022AEF1D2|nr:uroporphyrinogen-III C-methyltransferase [Maritalea porphyrae]MCZ4271763.1 uroporphyrinogen-III C-methyltransferase [Maritalea porphyrae]